MTISEALASGWIGKIDESDEELQGSNSIVK
jgi:hypothetical protein